MPNRFVMPLEKFRPPTELKLSAVWASLMFSYGYGDYFGLYIPGRLTAMSAGKMGSFGVLTPGLLTAVALMMAIPSLMVALSLLLPPSVNRCINLLAGLGYTAIMAMTMIGGAPAFYVVLGVIEMALTIGIVFLAWRWPRGDQGEGKRHDII